MMRGLSLFSGVGGIDIGLSPWVKAVTMCEYDASARAVLARHFPGVKIENDVRTISASPGEYDIIFGGFPCQDLSVAGKRQGLDGERSGLYSHVLRLADEAQPTFVFLENVPGVVKFLPRIRADFASRGYRLRAGRLSAAQVGAPHKRDRIFMLAAHTDSIAILVQQGRRDGEGGETTLQCDGANQTWDAAHTDSLRQLQSCRSVGDVGGWDMHDDQARDWQTPHDPLFLLDDGPALDVAGQKQLGNLAVPLQVREAFAALMGF